MNETIRLTHIINATSSHTALDNYFLLVYNPFLTDVLIRINSCELILKDALEKINISYGKKTFGQKIILIKKSEKIKEILNSTEFIEIIDSLEKANNYYNIIKHGHVVANESCLNVEDSTKVNLMITEFFGEDKKNKLHTYSYETRNQIIKEIQNAQNSLGIINRKVNEWLKKEELRKA